MMGSLVYRGRHCWSVVSRGRLLMPVARGLSQGKGRCAAKTQNKPLKQWTLIVSPLSGLRVRLPCHVRVTPQDPLTYPEADRVFVTVSGVDRNVHRGLDLDNIEVKYEQNSRQVLILSRDIDSHTCVDVTTPVRFDVNIKTSGTGCVNLKKIECDSCHIETEKGDSILESIKGQNVQIRTQGGKVVCLGTVHGNVDIHASEHSTVDIEKLLGTSVNISTQGGHLKAKYLYAESSSMSSSAGDISLGSIHGEIKAHTEEGNITVDSSDGCLEASTRQGAIDVYISQVGKTHLVSEEGPITVKIPATLQSHLQLSGAKIDLSPEVVLQDIQNSSREGQTTLTATINMVDKSENLIKVESKSGLIALKLQSWVQSLKLHTT
ncbi:protein FAM185A [Bombina bombina]|uniref:protein FAM185A n=1 Tax=Bombina bombina TaxID=8345 RepID=UPI00235AABAD|nr:protein FAM185A [Bombina bombina]